MKKRLPQLKDRIIDNGAYKVVALFIAIVIWVTLVSSRKDVVLNKELAVDFLASSSVNVELLEERNTMMVRLAGPRNLLRKFNESTSRISVDVTRYEPGDYTLRVDARLLELPLGIKMLGAKPEILRFRLSREILEERNNEQ